MHSRINSSHKRVTRQEANSAGEQEVHQTSEERVREEKHARHEACDVQLERVVPDAVNEDPEGRRAASEEGLPPPVMVLLLTLADCLARGMERRTSEHSCTYVATTETSITVMTRIPQTTAKKPNT